jgi:6-phosphogluconolactonase (cycloisomerase 2 family)
MFDRAPNGALTPAGTYPTGGLGTGAGLGSQGAVKISENGKWLFAVNAGSNEISVLSVEHDGLLLVDKVASGGTVPISLASHKDLLYVLNAGGAGSITGFTVGGDGHLSPLSGSTRPLSGSGVNPAQVEFSPDGRALVVTEKGTNRIDTYVIGKDGRAAGPMVYASSGTTPFGFAFGKHNRLVVSEAFGGAPNASAASSYALDGEGGLATISGSVPTHQTAACWLVVTGNGHFAYTTNAGSATISGYRIDENGSLALLDADGVTGVTGTSPIDLALSMNSRYLYALNAGTHDISAFRVEADGSLTDVAGAAGLPAGAVGLAAR